MGRRPSPLMQRWKTQKARRRRSSYFARGLQSQTGGLNKFMMGTDAMAYNKHASQRRHKELCKLFGIRVDLFMPPSPLGDPKAELERRATELYLLNHEDSQRYLRFSFVFIDGDESSDYSLSIHFSGMEFFLVERTPNFIHRSTIYSSKDKLLRLFDMNRVQWAGRVSINDT